jgi:putative membrane protein
MTTATQTTNPIAIGGIVAVSAAASGFLFWLLYFHPASPDYAGKLMFLPALNSVLNGMSAIMLVTGLALIKRKDRRAHKRAMLTAFVFSSLFLVSYIVHHALHGDTLFPHIGVMRTVYLSLLTSHILLSIIALPFVLITFFLALTGRFRQHKKIAKFTFPIWLYVSVTGVIVYAMLNHYVHS